MGGKCCGEYDATPRPRSAGVTIEDQLFEHECVALIFSFAIMTIFVFPTTPFLWTNFPEFEKISIMKKEIEGQTDIDQTVRHTHKETE